MKATSINRIVFAALLCCGLLLVNHNARAQCPDSTGPAPNPLICVWNSSSVYSEVPGTDCWDSVYFCFRNCGGDTSQIWINEVVPDPTSACDSLTPFQLLEGAETQVIVYLANEGYVPAGVLCGYPNLNLNYITTYVPSCWERQQKPSGASFFNTCVLYPPRYCQNTCQICVGNYSELSIYNCQETNVGICSCTTMAPLSNWELGTCYYSPLCVPPPPPLIESAKVGITSTIDTSLQAYPNPASGQLRVISSNGGAHFLILDVLGREVMTGVIPSNGPITLDVATLPAGTYYVSEGQTEVKFVKN
jgi:Secretion system C-terminal sorting domain